MTGAERGVTVQRQARLIAITHATGSHLRGWRHPNAPARSAIDVGAFVEVVQELERGYFDALFLSETTGVMPGPDEVHQHDSMVNESLDPSLLLAAVAAATRDIGLITTASTSLTQPYTLARMLASLDHLSGGRAGWNVVTSRFETEARNFGIAPELLRAPVRYHVAAEFVDLVMALWDGARRGERERWVHFPEPGPLDIARPPQGHPVLVQAGFSEEARALAARTADVVLAPGGQQQARDSRVDIRRRADAAGRDPEALVVLGLLPAVLVAETRAEAAAQLAEFTAFLHPAEKARHGILAATATDVADLIEQWLDADAVDGFAVGFPYLQGPAASFTRLVVPELQRRGRFRTAYTAGSLREHLGLRGPD